MSDKATTPRVRQACEPCRRKKTKCPGEKPICSFCARLGQRCTYEKGTDNSARIHKSRRSGSEESHGSRDRLQLLESRVEQILDTLSNITHPASDQRSSGLLAARLSDQSLPVSRDLTPARDSPAALGVSRDAHFDASRSHDPPQELWPVLINIYKQRFDHQPLLVLSPQFLLKPATTWPKYLRYSFLSLVVPFSTNHGFYRGSNLEAASFYTSSSRQEIMNKIASGDTDVAILQSLCLLSLREIIVSNTFNAWMNIGVAVRMALSTHFMSDKHESKIMTDQDTRSRCCWSLFILDRTYGATLTVPPTLSTEYMLPEFPISPARPTPFEEPPAQGPLIKDLGVQAYYLQLLSLWGSTMAYVRKVKHGESDPAWSSTSEYHKIMDRLFEFETSFAQIHRFQQTHFEEYDAQTLEQQRSYWAPWLSMQFLFHAIQGLVNHPFLHIASISRRQVFRPPTFMQNSIDQAVLHSSWILKCIEVCTEKSFPLNDPFNAHLVAITATIYLFLLNAKDSDLASQARHGLEKCYTFIRIMSDNWPHLRRTIEKLDILQHAASTTTSVPLNVSAPKAQRSLLWELLDYSASTVPSRIPEFSTDAVDLNVDTRFLSPLNPLSSGQTPGAILQNSHPQAQESEVEQVVDGNLWNPAMDSFEFNLFDNEEMADLTNMTFGRDIWGFGQL